jgi:hypothetical protein
MSAVLRDLRDTARRMELACHHENYARVFYGVAGDISTDMPDLMRLHIAGLGEQETLRATVGLPSQAPEPS